MTRVLIVEDDPTTSAMPVGALRRQQWEPVASGDLAGGWQGLCRERIDILLLDLSLPDGMGTDLLRQLRSSPSGELPDPKAD